MPQYLPKRTEDEWIEKVNEICSDEISMNVLDKKAIESLRSIESKTGNGLLSKLSRLYIENTKNIILKMKELLSQNNFKDLHREAHTLGSSSSCLGAIEISKCAATIEQKALHEESCKKEEVTQQIELIEFHFVKTEQALRKFIDKA